MKSLFFLLIFAFMISPVFSATYVPLSIEQQLQDSYGVLVGVYQGSSYKRISGGKVVTLASFHVEKHAGISANEIKNNQDFKILIPGGVWEGLTYFVSGVPTFKKGERVVLLISKGKYGIQMHNLALGKYHFVDDNGDKFLVSDVFPKHPQLGKISYDDFDKLVTNNFGSGVHSYVSDKYVYRKELKSKDNIDDKNDGREPASLEGKHDASTTFSPIVLILILALLGAYGAYLVRDK